MPLETVYVAYVCGSNNQLGPADAGISIYRKVTEYGTVQEEQQILEWTGTEICDEDGDLDHKAAEIQLSGLGWQMASNWFTSNDGQEGAYVEPWDDGRPVNGLEGTRG